MAHIKNNPDERILEMASKCSHCANEIRAFVLALIHSNSLIEPGLDSAGFGKFSMTESKTILGFPRRQYRYEICNCGGSIDFSWKKANVYLIDISCPSKGVAT